PSAAPIRSSRRTATSSTYPLNAANCSCNETAWLTRSSRRSPSTARCSARTRRSRLASTTVTSSDTIASAAAASATIPTVLCRPCMPAKDRRRAGRLAAILRDPGHLLEDDRDALRVVREVLLARHLL